MLPIRAVALILLLAPVAAIADVHFASGAAITIDSSNVTSLPIEGSCDSAGGPVTLLLGPREVNGASSGPAVSMTVPCGNVVAGFWGAHLDASSIPDSASLKIQAVQQQGNGSFYAESIPASKYTGPLQCSSTSLPDVTPLNKELSTTIPGCGGTIDQVLSLTQPARGNVPARTYTCAPKDSSGRICPNLPMLPSGTYNMTVSYVDAHGNPGASTVTLTFDKRVPRKRGHVDFNGDGKADLAWTRSDGTTEVWLMDLPNAPLQISTIVGPPGGRIKALADVNGDGKTDIVWRTPTGEYWIGLMNGGTQTSLVKMLGAGTGWEVMDSADLDSDGKVDLLWEHPRDGHAVWMMAGTTILQVAFLRDNTWKLLLIGDFNGDGAEDLAWQYANPYTTTTWITLDLMYGTTPYQQLELQSPQDTSPIPQLFAPGDFDGDGRDDILLRKGGDFAIWKMKPFGNKWEVAIDTKTVIRPNANNYNRVLVEDLDGDHRADLFWQDDSGAAEAWVMNGATATSKTAVLAGGSGWWLRGGDTYNGAGILWRSDAAAYGYWLMNPAPAFGVGATGVLRGNASGWEAAP